MAHFAHLEWSPMLQPFLTDYDNLSKKFDRGRSPKVDQMRVIPNSRKINWGQKPTQILDVTL